LVYDITIAQEIEMIMKKGKESKVEAGEINAFLGKGTDFNGKLAFEGTVRLDGKLSGEIYTPGTLIVGESAVLNADVTVNTLILSGELTGNIEAKTRVEIHAPAKLYGNINTPVLVIDEGVIFGGSCTMNEAGNNTVSILEKRDETLAAHA